MAFLDNSGDIILDAVLTDTGRHRLARGEFSVSSFALGDDEIDYSLYNKNHASGSSYYDLEILQTPVLEAFTNNTSSLKSKLMSISRTDLLYLPIIKLNQSRGGDTAMHATGSFYVAVDSNTESNIGTVTGVMYGQSTATPQVTIQLDQGLDTTELAVGSGLEDDLKETQYIIENTNTKTTSDDSTEVVSGPRGTIIKFHIKASLDLNTSTFLFTKLGGDKITTVTSSGGSPIDCFYIDSTVRVTGGTTGYKVDVPVRFIKKTS